MYYDNDTIIYFNGQFVKAADAKMDLYSQSLHYGYAVFEGIRSYPIDGSTRMFKGEEHYNRLRRSAELMKIPFAYSTQQLIDLTYETLTRLFVPPQIPFPSPDTDMPVVLHNSVFLPRLF